jgi:hypothetical protein
VLVVDQIPVGTTLFLVMLLMLLHPLEAGMVEAQQLHLVGHQETVLLVVRVVAVLGAAT